MTFCCGFWEKMEKKKFNVMINSDNLLNHYTMRMILVVRMLYVDENQNG